MKARISILTPVWNGLPFLQECIDSVVQQSVAEWEMLISDDCSTDDSRAYLKSLNDHRIKRFYQDKNLGIFGNLNYLYSHAKADTVLILCQDDFLLEDGLEKILETWKEADDEVAFICFNRPQLKDACGDLLPRKIQPKDSDFFFFLFGNIPGNLSCVSTRPDLTQRFGCFDQSFAYWGDFEFWSRVGRQSPFIQDPTAVTYIRRHEMAASNLLNRKGEVAKQSLSVVNQLFQSLETDPRFMTWKLRMYGTIVYDALQRHAGIMTLIRRSDPTYLIAVLKVEGEQRYSLHGFRWVIWLGSLGGRLWRGMVRKSLIRDWHHSKPNGVRQR